MPKDFGRVESANAEVQGPFFEMDGDTITGLTLHIRFDRVWAGQGVTVQTGQVDTLDLWGDMTQADRATLQNLFAKYVTPKAREYR